LTNNSHDSEVIITSWICNEIVTISFLEENRDRWKNRSDSCLEKFYINDAGKI